ncbi:unnamed protein product, partial [Acanthoscelides obtectus]
SEELSLNPSRGVKRNKVPGGAPFLTRQCEQASKTPSAPVLGGERRLSTLSAGFQKRKKVFQFLRWVSSSQFAVNVLSCSLEFFARKIIMGGTNPPAAFIHKTAVTKEPRSADVRTPTCRILKPNRHGDEYINRKGKPTLNVQATCDAREMFTSVIVTWPMIPEYEEIHRLDHNL